LAVAAPAPAGQVVDKELLFQGKGRTPAKTATGKTAKKRQKRAEKARAIEDSLRRDAAAAVREFEAGWGMGPAKKRRKRRAKDDTTEVEEQGGGVIEVTEGMTVEALADALDMAVSDVILELMDENVLATKNQTLDLDMVRRIAARHEFEVRTIIPEEEELLAEEPDAPESLVLRAPVVTVMGHVDHGKTTLLDVVRTANVAAGEAGGITQHIAAYEVEMSQGRVVFLDTPGHEAFTQMRARGAQVTDVVVLVVAADDGVKPQTVEAIDHAKAAGVPIVVAINKCDKADAQPDRVRQELTQYELVDEAWGGKTIMKNISAKARQGVDDLMEMLVLEAQMLDLKANPNKRARGAIVESEITRGMGPVAWVLVQNGTLKVGDVFLAGSSYGRVRSMTSSRGEPVMEAGPSTPVLVTGFNTPPDAGDIFVVVQDERVARAVADKRGDLNRQKRGPSAKRMTLEDFHARMLGGDQKTLHIIIKADVQGSVDVLESSFAKLGNEEVKVEIVHAGVGGINESDVLLASASDAVVLGFHVTANPKVQRLAEHEGVEIRTYLVIYEAIEEVRHALEGLLTPDIKEIISGHAEVRQVFRSSAIGNIAGCFQTDGETQRGSKVRLVRDGTVVYDGRVATVRRGKDDVRSVSTGFECGITLERYDDIQAGDIIESYREEQVAKTLA
jgi:translation initiation factor IF-2